MILKYFLLKKEKIYEKREKNEMLTIYDMTLVICFIL